MTTSNFEYRRRRRNRVPFLAGEFGLTADCVAQCERLAPLDFDQIELAAGLIGVLDDAKFRQVVRAIGFVIGSECEPE
jgi:hypothetical protein